jgi:hypothetical protein
MKIFVQCGSGGDSGAMSDFARGILRELAKAVKTDLRPDHLNRIKRLSKQKKITAREIQDLLDDCVQTAKRCGFVIVILDSLWEDLLRMEGVSQSLKQFR